MLRVKTGDCLTAPRLDLSANSASTDSLQAHDDLWGNAQRLTPSFFCLPNFPPSPLNTGLALEAQLLKQRPARNGFRSWEKGLVPCPTTHCVLHARLVQINRQQVPDHGHPLEACSPPCYPNWTRRKPWQPLKYLPTPCRGKGCFPTVSSWPYSQAHSWAGREGPSSYPTALGLQIDQHPQAALPTDPDILKSPGAPGYSTMTRLGSSLLCCPPPLRDETFVSETEMILDQAKVFWEFKMTHAEGLTPGLGLGPVNHRIVFTQGKPGE